MCLAIPVRVVALLEGDWAEAEIGGIRSRVSTALLDGVRPGDFLIVHAGFAITRLDVAEAERTLALFDSIRAHQRDLDDAASARPGEVLALPARIS
jgi:hydrogenase expression/formation protein HypC